MTTARDIVKKSLQKIGALVKSEEPQADEADDGLAALNALMASWGNDSLNEYARTLETFTLTGAASYTIGSGGNFNTVRPSNIVSATVRSGSIDYVVNIIDDSTYNDIPYKNTTGTPLFLNYSNAYPLGVIKLYPIDNGMTSITLLTEKPLNGFATLDTDMSLPDGWERALIYNLALDLAPEYNQKPDAYVIKVAQESLGLIRSKVAQVRGMDAFPNGVRVRNIYSGWAY